MTPSLLGGIGLTHLQVYHHRPDPDGRHTGCAHIHALTPEAYFGLHGEGAIELHDPQNGFRSVPILPGTFVQFAPGTLHRSVSTDNLRVLAIMGNGGLPERGDARIYFGPEADADEQEFERLKGLVRTGLEGALERRDVSALAYRRLMRLWETDKPAYRAELVRFLDVHRRAIAGNRESFEEAVRTGPLAAGRAALAGLAALAGPSAWGEGSDAASAVKWTSDRVGSVYGMCGILHQVENMGAA